MKDASFTWRWLAPLIFVFLWSGGFAVAKIGLRDAPPMTFLALRYALVLVVLGSLILALRPPFPATRRDYGHLAVTRFCIQVLYFRLLLFRFLARRIGGGPGADRLPAAHPGRPAGAELHR